MTLRLKSDDIVRGGRSRIGKPDGRQVIMKGKPAFPWTSLLRPIDTEIA